MEEIPRPRLEDVDGSIPPTASELSQDADDPEAHPFLISFERYNLKECQVSSMESKLVKKTLSIIRDIGMVVKSFEGLKANFPKLQIATISNSGSYRDLFKGLSDILDIEMYEVKTDRDSGRLFFFVINRIFHIVAMRDSHYDTDKQRR